MFFSILSIVIIYSVCQYTDDWCSAYWIDRVYRIGLFLLSWVGSIVWNWLNLVVDAWRARHPRNCRHRPTELIELVWLDELIRMNYRIYRIIQLIKSFNDILSYHTTLYNIIEVKIANSVLFDFEHIYNLLVEFIELNCFYWVELVR